MHEFDIVAFERALLQCDESVVREFLTRTDVGEHINCFLPGVAATPLLLACTLGHLGMVELLCDHGADIDLPGKEGATTPLMAATHGKREDIVNLLVNRGAQVGLLDEQGRSALVIAVEAECHAIAKTLLFASGPVERKDQARIALRQAAASGCNETVAMLLGAMDTGARRDAGRALIEAASEGYIPIARKLLEFGAGIDTPDDDGATALMVAGAKGQLEMVQFLISNGANPGCADKKRRNAFQVACRSPSNESCRSDILASILRASSHMDHVNDAGETILMHAVQAQDRLLVEMILARSPSINHADARGMTALHHAAQGPDAALVALLLQHGADPTVKSGQRMRTALHAAADANQPDNVAILAIMGEVETVDAFGDTPLLSAAGLGCDESALALITAGADINASNDRGGLLHHAATGGCRKLLEVAMAKGLSLALEKPNKAGRTALHEAAASGQGDAGDVLILAGANPWTKTPEGLTSHDLGDTVFNLSMDEAIACKQAQALLEETGPAPKPSSKRRM